MFDDMVVEKLLVKNVEKFTACGPHFFIIKSFYIVKIRLFAKKK